MNARRHGRRATVRRVHAATGQHPLHATSCRGAALRRRLRKRQGIRARHPLMRGPGSLPAHGSASGQWRSRASARHVDGQLQPMSPRSRRNRQPPRHQGAGLPHKGFPLPRQTPAPGAPPSSRHRVWRALRRELASVTDLQQSIPFELHHAGGPKPRLSSMVADRRLACGRLAKHAPNLPLI